MTEITQVLDVLDLVKSKVQSIADVVAAMKQTNTSNIPLRQQILVRWRDKLYSNVENINQIIAIFETLIEKEKAVKPVINNDKISKSKMPIEFKLKVQKKTSKKR
jgi:hypothetical protein